MKFKPIIIAFSLAALLVSGCGPGSNTEGNETEPDEEEFQEVSYQVADSAESFSEEINKAVDALQEDKGFFVFTPGDYPIDEPVIFISAGEKPTSGYHIEVEEVVEDEGALYITVRETEPGDDDIVAQVLTYPKVFLQLERAFDNYTVVDEDNNPFPQFDRDELEEKLEKAEAADPEREKVTGEEGVFSGLIDNHTVEIEIDGEATAFGISPDVSFEGLERGDTVVIDYYEDEHGRLIITGWQAP